MRFSNSVELRIWGRYALFSEPITRVGGEKCSYPVPTYQALKGILESCYWKPTFIWCPDELRVMRAIETESKGIRSIRYSDGKNDLSFYTYLVNVEYRLRAHFEWNEHRPDLTGDRDENKHYFIARRMLERGGNPALFPRARVSMTMRRTCRSGSWYTASPTRTRAATACSMSGYGGQL